MTEANDGDERNSGPRLKVARLIEEYGFDSVGEELESRWASEGEDGMSLRELAAYFNRQVLAAELADADLNPVSGEVENLYRLLTDDAVSPAERTRAQRRLDRDGIDVDALQERFVTYQAVRSYLKKHRNAEPATEDRPRIDVEAEHIQRLTGRTAAVTQTKLTQLVADGTLSLGEFRVLVNVSVFCDDCNTRYDVGELVERGGCACASGAE